LENGPPGPNRRVILSDFCLKALAEASEFFFRNIANEMHLQRQIAEETLTKYQNELKEMKDEQRSKADFYENKIRLCETEKAELSAKEQYLRENLSQVIREKDQLDMEMTSKLDHLKKDNAR